MKRERDARGWRLQGLQGAERTTAGGVGDIDIEASDEQLALLVEGHDGHNVRTNIPLDVLFAVLSHSGIDLRRWLPTAAVADPRDKTGERRAPAGPTSRKSLENARKEADARKEAAALSRALAAEALELGFYRHYKGKEVRVFAVSLHEETLGVLVHYFEGPCAWTRTLENFQETLANGAKRFTFLRFAPDSAETRGPVPDDVLAAIGVVLEHTQEWEHVETGREYNLCPGCGWESDNAMRSSTAIGHHDGCTFEASLKLLRALVEETGAW